MIVGHVGIAFGARALDRREADARAPLAWLVAATYAPDLLDGVYALAKFCNPSGAFSHSLPVVALLAVVFGIAAFAHTRDATTALLVGLLVTLHLPPDYLTGIKSLWPGGPVTGLYIYRWGWADFSAEAPVIAAGWWMLRRRRLEPVWIVSALALGVMLAVQAGFDLRETVAGPRVPPVCTH